VSSSKVLIADRSRRGKLRFTGEQRAWFLHQILTQGFEDIRPGEARAAAMITAHGRLSAYLEALATQDAIYCHFEPELLETLPALIRSYVFATRVEVEDVTDEYGLILLVGENWRELASAKVPVPRIHETLSVGVPAGYVWLDRVYLGDVLAELGRDGGQVATEEELERIRIEGGVARWGFEMDTKTFPQEAGIDRWAVNYDKGCYLGQEAMAKIHFRGRVNRRLARVEAGADLSRGTELTLDDGKAGVVTSADAARGIALVRHDIEAGTLLQAGDVDVKVVD
jgi:folate-binding protein YgfZ